MSGLIGRDKVTKEMIGLIGRDEVTESKAGGG
jgi:hypothetical protein